jgi:hypothetical protein
MRTCEGGAATATGAFAAPLSTCRNRHFFPRAHLPSLKNWHTCARVTVGMRKRISQCKRSNVRYKGERMRVFEAATVHVQKRQVQRRSNQGGGCGGLADDCADEMGR